nr:hypothetical protein [Tanacetum cinerariifolium]
MIAKMDQDADVVLEDDKEVADDAKADQDAKVVESVDIQGRQAESQAEIYKIDLKHANKIITKVVTAASETITAASTTITAAEAQVPATTLTAAPARVTAAPSRRRKGVVIRDPQEDSNTSTIIPAETKSKDKGKRILVEEPKPLKKLAQIEQDEQYARELEAELNRNIDWDEVIDHVKKKAKEDPAVKRYQDMKRKPQTEAQARKNMMIYLKNVIGFKMDYFKGMSYDDIRPVFEKHFDLNVAFLQKTKEHIEEEESRALKRINETPAEKAAKRQKLDKEVEELKRHLQKLPRLLESFLLEDLEALWSLVKERFATAKPKNFSDDFLMITLGSMLESCGVQIITFTTTQLILLVERSTHSQGIQEKHAKCLMLLAKDLVLSSQDDVVD